MISAVEQVELTKSPYIYPGGVHVYRSGDSIAEGAHHIQVLVNQGPGELVLVTTYTTPEVNCSRRRI